MIVGFRGKLRPPRNLIHYRSCQHYGKAIDLASKSMMLASSGWDSTRDSGPKTKASPMIT